MKKLFSLLAAVVLLLSMAGCHKEEPSAPTEPTTPPAPQSKTVYVHSSVTHTFGGALSKTEYIYDDNDRLIEVVVYNGDAETHRYQVTCDENDNPIRWVTTIEGKESATEYAYDAQGHSLGTKIYSAGELVTSMEYVWAGGVRVSVIAKAPPQSYETRTEYTYDDRGHMIRQDLYTNGQLSNYSICTTDDQGRLTRTDSFTPEGAATGSTVYTYDGTNETRTFLDAQGQVSQKMLLTYDDAGNLLTSTTRDRNGLLLASEEHTWKAIEVSLDSLRASI